LATRLGAKRNAVEEAVGRLASQGFVELYREGSKKVVKYVKGYLMGLERLRLVRRAIG